MLPRTSYHEQINLFEIIGDLNLKEVQFLSRPMLKIGQATLARDFGM